MKGRMILKLLVLGGIAVILIMVLSSIGGLALERKGRQYQVEREIAGSYAGSQRIGGPVFAVQFREFWTEKLYNQEKDTWYEKELSADRVQLVYPSLVSYAGQLSVQERYRGIFKANVFQSDGHLAGSVRFPAVESLLPGQ